MSEGEAADDDAALLKRFRSGDAAAFHALIDRHAGRLYGVARSLLGNTADAEDVVQETFAGAFQSAKAFRGEASVKTWLLKILVRQVARARRSRGRWRFLSLSGGAAAQSADDANPLPGDAGPGAESTAADVDTRLDLAVMLRRLSPEHREVIVLRELQGLSYEEIAAALDVPRGTVESRLHRARRELREKFAGYFES